MNGSLGVRYIIIIVCICCVLPRDELVRRLLQVLGRGFDIQLAHVWNFD